MDKKITLQIINGPLLGTKYAIHDKQEVIIGRGQGSTICIPREIDSMISRSHCKIVANLPSVKIVDLNSTNGTLINGADVIEPAALSSGDHIGLGTTHFVIQIPKAEKCINCNKELTDDDSKLSTGYTNLNICSECNQHIKEYSDGAISSSNSEIDLTVTASIPFKIEKFAPPQRTSIEKFEILKKLGQGGMGSVYMAKHKVDGEIVALKIMLPTVSRNPVMREDFMREIETTHILNHKNIVRLVHTNEETANDLFFTMEFCSAGNIYDYVSAQISLLSVEKAYQIIRPCIEALDYAHTVKVHNIRLNDGRSASARGLVHRDIKPSNIFLTETDGVFIPKIADFGLAKAHELAGFAGNTIIGTIAGSLGYIPRQQVRDFKFVKPEVDLWSLMASFYYILTKKTPRDFPKSADEITTVLETMPVPIRHRRESIPESLAEIIDLSLIDSHDLYFKSARELLKTLDNVMSKA